MINAVAALVWPFVLTLVSMAIDQNTALAEIDYTPFVEDIAGEETSQETTGSAQAGFKSDPRSDWSCGWSAPLRVDRIRPRF